VVAGNGRRSWLGAKSGALAILVAGMVVQAWAADGVVRPAAQDHQMMMDALGITKLRPPVSSEPDGPNPANYSEVRANPYPLWPDPLVDSKFRKVTTREQWWAVRRPELIELFEREIYGRIPHGVPMVTWTVDIVDHENLGFTPITATRVIGHVDNSGYPEVSVDIPMIVVRPAQPRQSGPMPLLIMFQLGGVVFPAPAQPSVAELERINAALKKQMVAQDPSLSEVLSAHPGWQPVSAPQRLPAQPDLEGGPPPLQQLIADGWAVALIDPTTIQPDSGDGLTRGIIGLTSHGLPRKPDDWGVLRAWAWGASRAFDYLSTQPDIDARHIGVEGVSRYGKAALVAMAFDMRFAIALVASSGQSGTKPHRRNFGETVENQAGVGAYHWVAGNFLKYAAAESSLGSKTAADIPVDAGELIALCAPRWTFISYGSPENGDPPWVDQRGSFMAAVQAGRVYRLLGARDLGVGDDYQQAQLPPVGTGLLDGELAWRQHGGGHTDAPNIKHFLDWADRLMKRTRH
jgi:hypothetical protein